MLSGCNAFIRINANVYCAILKIHVILATPSEATEQPQAGNSDSDRKDVCLHKCV